MTAPAREIHVHIRDPWASVPIRLMEAGCGLSSEARLALIYMLDLGRRPGWTIYVSQVQRALGYGPRRWPRIRRELEARGYFRARRGHAENGDWSWTYHIFDTPDGIPPSSIPAECMDADCIDADRLDRRSSTSRRSTSKRAAVARTREQPAASAAGSIDTAERQASGLAATSARRRRTDAETGIVYWLADEPAEIARLIEAFGIEAVKSEAARLLEAGTEPLPSHVAKSLQSARRTAVAAAASAARRRKPTPEELAEDRRRAEEAMAAYTVSRDAPQPIRHRDTRSLEQILRENFGVKP